MTRGRARRQDRGQIVDDRGRFAKAHRQVVAERRSVAAGPGSESIPSQPQQQSDPRQM
jgi:hypothetical protein